MSSRDATLFTHLDESSNNTTTVHARTATDMIKPISDTLRLLPNDCARGLTVIQAQLDQIQRHHLLELPLFRQLVHLPQRVREGELLRQPLDRRRRVERFQTVLRATKKISGEGA